MKLLFTILQFVFVLQAYSQITKDSLVELVIQKNGGRGNLESLNSFHKKSYSFSNLLSLDTSLITYFATKSNKFVFLSENKKDITKFGYSGKESWYRKYDKKNLDTAYSFLKENMNRIDFGKKKIFSSSLNILIFMDVYSSNEGITIEYDKELKDEKCIIIKILNTDFTEYNFFINPVSYRIMAMAYIKGNDKSITFYQDYRKVKDVYYPFKIYTEIKKDTFYEIITDIQINPTISEDIFEPPQK